MSTAPWSLDVFVNLSSALTGVAAEQLKPDLDPIGIADQYFATLTGNVASPLLEGLAAAFQSVPDPNQAAGRILADPVLGGLGRSIIKLWLLGAWYSPVNPGAAVNVVSAQAYKESLVWKVMQSHPMGYSMFTFGYWAAPPPPLGQFIQFAPPTAASATTIATAALKAATSPSTPAKK